MDLVLGLSMTSTAVRWVLVEGTTGEGATIHRDGIDFDTLDDIVGAVGDNRLHAVGVTWTNEAEAEASLVLDALAARGLDNVITVSELEAADVLAAGIADRGSYDDVAVCLVEPDAAVIAIVTPRGVTVDRIARPLDEADAVELPSSVISMLELDNWQPEAVFVVGSADDLDLVMSTLAGLTEAPVFSAAEADLALARGAALASARAVNTLEAPRAPLMTRTAALTSVLVAAVVIFVISLSVALGLGLTPGTDTTPEQRPAADAVDAPAPAAPPNYVPPAPPQPRLRDRIIERIPIINRFHEPELQYPR